MHRERLKFGHGSFIGDISKDPTFFDLPVDEQARIAGWVNGCPVVEELIDRNNPEPGRGPENMLNRYSEINFWFGFIQREVARLNPELHGQFMAPVPRNSGEPGKYEEISVPTNHTTEMSPMGTLAGYAISRLFIDQLGTDKDLPTEEVQTRLNRALDVLEEAIELALFPNELLAIVSDGISKADVKPMDVLKRVLGQGWYEEHKADIMLGQFKYALNRCAPELWNLYESLSPEEKAKNKLV